MGDFKPSTNFIAKTMAEIHTCEAALSYEMKRDDALRFSKPVLYVLSTGGLLLGIVNLIRFAFVLISPALCL